MKPFSFVIFGFTSNLAQLKIIPALYDLEEKGLLSPETKIIGIGRKEIDTGKFISDVLHTQNRHHLHKIKPEIQTKLIERTVYFQEDFEKKDGPLYGKLKKISGNILYYLATYPNLYTKIFQSLKDNSLNDQDDGWVRIMIEKPIGNDLATAKDLDNLLNEYFEENQIFRVDHYLGKEVIRKMFGSGIKSKDAERIEISIFENFGIGKRGVYYDATGALIDMGQNHLLQMLAAVTAKSANREDRAEVLESLKPEPKNIIFGQYEGYLKEENVSPVSTTDTFFVLKTEMEKGPWKGIPIYLSSGKKLNKNETKIVIYYKNSESKFFEISPLKIPEKFDPYERLILDAVAGDQTYFNSPQEIEASWKFIDEFSRRDKLSGKLDSPFIYKPGSDLTNGVASKFSP
jgi:glucose-6-phosphate 1-dehydrogenase